MEYLIEDEPKKAAKIHYFKENQFDDYFQNTEKLGNNTEFIKEYEVNGKIIGRQFLNKNKEIQYNQLYLEIFENTKLELMGISPNITFLYISDKEYKKDITKIK